MAVGTYVISLSDGTSTGFPLAESWNGKTWSILKTPPLDFGGSFYSVSCTSNLRCMAVGDANGPTLAESWNGKTWSVLQTAFLSYAAGGDLDSISCPAVSLCMAVGVASLSSGGSGVAESWNGKLWSLQKTTLDPNGQSDLNSVSCPSASRCIAVGYLIPAVGHVVRGSALVESWNGESWSTLKTPNPGAVVALGHVACTSASTCIAINGTVTESWNGKSWSLQKTPALNGGEPDSVSCTSASRCIAVGISGSSDAPQAFGESWNGRTWSILNTPTP
jgi:hypothetical protein